MTGCRVCGDYRTVAKGRCRTCYEYLRRYGRDRTHQLVARQTQRDIDRHHARRDHTYWIATGRPQRAKRRRT